MKKEYSLSGDFENTSIDILEKVFKTLTMKVREENSDELYVMNYTDNLDMDLHVYDARSSSSGDKDDLLVNGTVKSEFQLIKGFFREVTLNLEKNNIIYNFELCEDSLGKVSEEFVFRHPDF
jgi:hypothetical protein